MLVALDVGGSSVKAGLLQADRTTPVGDVVTTRLNNRAAADVIIGRFAKAVTAVATEHTYDRIAIAVPAPFDYRGGVSWMTHKFAALHAMAIAPALVSRLEVGIEVTVGFCNDGAAAAMGEAVAGAGATHRRVLGVTLGTGLGAALIVDRAPVEVAAGIEIGDLWRQPTQRHPSADAALSARSLWRAIAAGDAESATSGDTAAAQFGDHLGEFLAPVVTAVNADVVVIGGGGVASFERFAPALAERVGVRVAAASLGRWAPLVGAATLCFGE